MFTHPSLHPSLKSSVPMFAAGDLVRPRTDQATLCEVLGAEDDNRIRVRGVDWSPGFSAILHAEEIYLVSRGGSEPL